MMVNWFPNDNADIHDGLNTLSFTNVIVSSDHGQDNKQKFLECRWYNLPLDRTIYKAKAGIKVLCYLYLEKSLKELCLISMPKQNSQ
jgi:hypothetical protein